MGDAEASALWWGDVAAMDELKAKRGPFDVVLCCEVVYQQPQEALDALLQTLQSLVAPKGQIVFAYQYRDGAEYTDIAFFEALCRQGSGFRLSEGVSLSDWDESWDDPTF